MKILENPYGMDIFNKELPVEFKYREFRERWLRKKDTSE